jgi:hypothetical protein
VPDLVSFEPLAAVIALGAAVALIRFMVNVPLVIVACALAGLLRLV